MYHTSFQFTTSRGGRHTVFRIHGRALNFQFTTSRGGRLTGFYLLNKNWCLSIHDLTRRSTFYLGGFMYEIYPFNSRPHEEVDSSTTHQRRLIHLSIHDLTRRSTNRRNDEVRTSVLSIHDLTRRSTMILSLSLSLRFSFNSLPHEEVDRKPCFRGKTLVSFNSRPHEEVDVKI